ncbi:glycoside hydrolase family 28 protein [Prevotella sp.]|uniref:glycoside hydrolase family 28 protein n=2 Tax=Prevotella TaxID=838 RepID=UPI0030800946
MKKYIAIIALLCVSISVFASGFDEAKRDSILRHISGAKIPTRTVNILKLGAKGDGKKDCLPAFRKALKQSAQRGGLRIIVPAGTYYIKGPIHLVSNTCIDLQEGATLKFAPQPEYYLPMVKTSWEGTFLQNYSPFIYGYGLHDVAIIGKGTIDGNAATTFATWRKDQRKDRDLSRQMNHDETPVAERNFGKGSLLRPQLIQLFNCTGITLSDFFITNSPFWCVHLLKSENVICRRLRYDAKLVNNDGIDPECSRNVLIEDVSFNNGDDNVAIKSCRDNDGWNLGSPSENIIIRNCRFKGLHAVVIGSEMSAGVRNVFVENCTYAGYCKRGIFVKTNPNRGGFVENLYVRNCEFDEVEDLFYVTSMYAGEGMDDNHFSTVRNIFVDGLRCNKARIGGIILQGTEAKPVSNVTFRNVDIKEVKNALSMDNTESVVFSSCHLGGKAGVPTQVTAKDNLFSSH